MAIFPTTFDLAVFEALPRSFQEQASAAWIARALCQNGISATDNSVRRSLERLAKEGFAVCCNKRKSPPYGWFRSDLLSRFGHYTRSLVWGTRSNVGISRRDLACFLQVRHPGCFQAAGGSDAVTLCDWVFGEAMNCCYATWVDGDGEVVVRLLGFYGFYWLKRTGGKTVGVYASADDAVSQFDGCEGWEKPLTVHPYRYFDYMSDDDREWLRDHATFREVPALKLPPF